MNPRKIELPAVIEGTTYAIVSLDPIIDLPYAQAFLAKDVETEEKLIIKIYKRQTDARTMSGNEFDSIKVIRDFMKDDVVIQRNIPNPVAIIHATMPMISSRSDEKFLDGKTHWACVFECFFARPISRVIEQMRNEKIQRLDMDTWFDHAQVIFEVLSKIHGVNRTHRAMTTQNIMIVPDHPDQTMIMGFEHLGKAKDYKYVKGDSDYFSPELALVYSGIIDSTPENMIEIYKGADVHSTTQTLARLWLATDSMPWIADNEEETIERILKFGTRGFYHEIMLPMFPDEIRWLIDYGMHPLESMRLTARDIGNILRKRGVL